MSRIDLPKIYNPAIQTPEELIDNFVVRTALFKEIFKDIKTSKMNAPEQHYIIRGIRGQGKTTLLLRLTYEIAKDNQLKKRLIPVCFNEEQYNISRLFKLWETVADHLREHKGLSDLHDRMQQLDDDDDYEARCFELLESALKANKKKLVLLIDNIDDILNKFSKKELQRLREVFTECAEIRVVGASAGVLEFHHKYNEPFYEFFKTPMLKGLTTAETRTLLLKLSVYYKKDEVAAIVNNQPGRVESLRRITGGVIRTIVIMFQMFADDPDGRAFLDLETILDSVTPLYKERMDRLSAQHQEIVDCIALNWDAITAGEIAKKTRIPSKAVSAQLKQLEKYHIIEKVRTSTKNNLYRIAERFFNIWYLMRHGRKWDEKRVKFLVEFLQMWCDKDDLKTRAMSHLQSIKENRCCERQALYIAEALSRTPIDRDLQHQLLSETRSYLQKERSSLASCLSKSDNELTREAIKSIESGDIEDAIKTFEAIKHKNGHDFNKIGLLYKKVGHNKKAEESWLNAVDQGLVEAMFNLAMLYEDEFKDFKKAKKYYLLAVDQGDVDAMFSIAMLYEDWLKDHKKAEKYYLMAVDKGDVCAMYNLALLHHNKFKDFKKAEKYYLMAVDKGYAKAMFNLAVLYDGWLKDFTQARKYYLMAVDQGIVEAINNLALLYEDELRDLNNAEKYYLIAVDKGDVNAMFNLALLHHKKLKDFKKAEKYYLMALDNGYAKAMFNLAMLHENEFRDFKKAKKYYLMAVKQGNAGAMSNLALMFAEKFNDFKKAEKYWLMAVDQGDVNAMFNLALLYRKKFKDYKQSEKYYLMAADQGDVDAMNGLAWCYFERKESKANALEYAESAFTQSQELDIAHTYASILLWHDMIEKAVEVSNQFLSDNTFIESHVDDVGQYLMLLIAKKQYHTALNIFNDNPGQLRDRLKPVYYALTHFLKNELPDEWRKMGEELKETVDEVIAEIGRMQKEYD